LILGVGTGRCGTKSLVRLLDAQPGTRATHERFGSAIRWNCPENLWPLRLWQDTAEVEGPSFLADVAFNWVPHVQTFLGWADRDHREVRIVALKRDREEVVSSYLKWKRRSDHWRPYWEHDSGPDEWDHCYPSFPADTKGEAIGRFWDQCYDILDSIQDERLKIFRTEDLNSEEGVRSILEHCGYENPNVEVGIQITAASIEDARKSDQW